MCLFGCVFLVFVLKVYLSTYLPNLSIYLHIYIHICLNTHHYLVAPSNSCVFTNPPWKLNHSTWKRTRNNMDFCLVSCAWRNCHNFSEPSVGKANHTSNRKLQPQPKPKQMEQKHVLLAWFTLPKWMQNNPKPKQMQQSNPDIFLPWLTLPKWMKPNPKPKEVQQVILMQCVFFSAWFCMTYPTQVNETQSKTKTTAASYIILMQWQWLFTLLKDCFFRLSVEKVWYTSFLSLFSS